MTSRPLRIKVLVPPSEINSMTDSSSRMQSLSKSSSKTCKKRPHSLESLCKMLSKKLLTRLKKISMRILRRKTWILSIESRKPSSKVFIRTEDQAKVLRIRTRLRLSSRPKTSSTKRLIPISRPLVRNSSKRSKMKLSLKWEVHQPLLNTNHLSVLNLKHHSFTSLLFNLLDLVSCNYSSDLNIKYK